MAYFCLNGVWVGAIAWDNEGTMLMLVSKVMNIEVSSIMGEVKATSSSVLLAKIWGFKR